MTDKNRTRLFVRVVDGSEYLQLLAIAGITAVLVTRAYLELTNYPQLGGSSLHIAHVLWGGLFMLAGLASALLFIGRGARLSSAILGGIGLGLFIDEVGKFVTNDNDYFYRPAAAIIYLTFAGLLVFTSLVRQDKLTDANERVANAAEIAATGIVSGLTPSQRAKAERLLTGHDEKSAKAVGRLLAAAPSRKHSALFERYLSKPISFAERLAENSWVTAVAMTLLVLGYIVASVRFVMQSITITSAEVISVDVEEGAVIGSAIATTVSTVLVLIGATRWKFDRRSAFTWFRAGVLVDLLLAQVFNFTNDQFSAVAALPFTLMVLALIQYHLRKPEAHS